MTTFQIQKNKCSKDTPYISISNSKSDSSNLQIESSHLSLNNSNHSPQTLVNNNNTINNNVYTFTNANISNLITSNSGCELNISKSTFNGEGNLFNNEISFENSSFSADNSNNNLQISSNSIIFKKNNENSSIITKKNSALYSPSTICNYYEITPNKLTPNNINNKTQNTNKPKLKQINIANLNITSKSDDHDNSVISDNGGGSNNRKIYEKKTPIKYTKSQLKSGEKKKLNFPLDNLSSIGNNKNNSSSNNSNNYYSGIVGSSSYGGSNALIIERGKNGGITSRKNLMDTFEKLSKEAGREYYSNGNNNNQVEQSKQEKVDLYFMKVLNERGNKKEIESNTIKKNETFSFDNKNNTIAVNSTTNNTKPVQANVVKHTSAKKSVTEKKKEVIKKKPNRPLSFTKKITINFSNDNNKQSSPPSTTKKENPISKVKKVTTKKPVPISTPRNKFQSFSNYSFKDTSNKKQNSFAHTSRPSSSTKTKPISLVKKTGSNIPIKTLLEHKPKSQSKVSTEKLKLNLFDDHKKNVKKINQKTKSNKILPMKNKYIINTTSSSKTSNCSTGQKDNKKSNTNTPKESFDLNNKISKVKIDLYDTKSTKTHRNSSNTQLKVINNFTCYHKAKNTKAISERREGRNKPNQKENLSTQVKFNKLQILPGDSDSEVNVDES